MTKYMLLDFLQICLKDENGFKEKFKSQSGTLDKVVTYMNEELFFVDEKES